MSLTLWQRIGINSGVALASISGAIGGFLIGRQYYGEEIYRLAWNLDERREQAKYAQRRIDELQDRLDLERATNQ